MVKPPDGMEAQSDLLFLLSRLDEQIRIELDLVGQRMNVLAVSQAFLFTAFTTDMLIPDPFKTLRTVLLWMIPLLGTAICVIIGLALGAAVSVIHTRKGEREIVRDRIREDLENNTLRPESFRSRRVDILEHVSPRSWPDRLGNYPPVFLAPAIGVCWIILLVFLSK